MLSKDIVRRNLLFGAALFVGIFLVFAGLEISLCLLEGQSLRTHWQNILSFPPKRTWVYSPHKLSEKTSQQEVLFDEYGRRAQPRLSGARFNKAAVFIGGSFVFGQGLERDETLPYYFENLSREYKTYNYGLRGGSPAMALKRFQEFPLNREIDKKVRLVFYLFIDAHIDRVRGGLHAISYVADSPRYTLSSNGTLQDHGTFRQAGGKWTSLRELFSSLFLVQRWVIPQMIFSKEDYRLFSAVVDHLRRVVEDQHPGARFITVIYPESRWGNKVERYLTQKSIEVWNFGAEKRPRHLQTHPDGHHPSGAENRYMAEKLIEQLPSKQ